MLKLDMHGDGKSWPYKAARPTAEGTPHWILWAVSTLALAMPACIDLGTGGGSDTTTLSVDLGPDGLFSFDASGQQSDERNINLDPNDLPTAAPAFGNLRLDPAVLAITPTGDDNSPVVDFTFFFAESGDDNPCGNGAESGPFTVTRSASGAETIEPSAAPLPADALDVIMTGRFRICVEVSASAPLDLELDQIDLILTSVTGSGCTALAAGTPSCGLVRSNETVNTAIEMLENNKLLFDLIPGTDPPNVLGNWNFTRTVEFDPDGANIGDTSTGTISFSQRTGSTITQTISGASLDFSIEGTGNAMSLCSFARSGGDCNQSVAGMTTFQLSPDGQTLAGTFLSVVACGGSNSGGCSAAGDFVFGTMNLVRANSTATAPTITSTGKVTLPEGTIPQYLAVLPDDAGGVLATAGGDLFRFDVAEPFAVHSVDVPLDSSFGFAGLGVTTDGARYGVVLDGAARLVVIDSATDGLIGQAYSPGFNLAGGRFNFSPAGDEAYLFSPHSGDDDNVVILPAESAELVAADDTARADTPFSQTPRATRLNRLGTQWAVLMAGTGDAGESSLLAFVDLTGNLPRFSSLINLEALGAGRVRDSSLQFSSDGANLLLAGSAGVVSVETTEPYRVRVLDVSRGNGDDVVALDTTIDGSTMIAAVAADQGEIDLAIIRSDPLAPLSLQNLSELNGQVTGVAAFDNAFAALVSESDGAQLVAVQTRPPYAILGTFTAGQAASDQLGMMEAGGGIVAVVNLDEPAIYLFAAE